jgi:hypothetical protein
MKTAAIKLVEEIEEFGGAHGDQCCKFCPARVLGDNRVPGVNVFDQITIWAIFANFLEDPFI